MFRADTSDAHCRLAGVGGPTMIVGVCVQRGTHITQMLTGTAIELADDMYVPRALKLAYLFHNITAPK